MNRPELEKTRYRAARDLLEAAVEKLPGDARVHGSLVIVYAGLDRPEDAIHEGKLGLELLGGAQDLDLGWRIKDLAQIYVMVGADDEAIDQLEHLLSRYDFVVTPQRTTDTGHSRTLACSAASQRFDFDSSWP